MRITERVTVTLGTREAAAAIDAAASRLAERMERSESQSVLDAARGLFGSNAGIAAAMGFSRGETGSAERREYNNALRAIQRAEAGEGKQQRPLPAKYAEKLADKIPADRPRLKEALSSGKPIVNEPRELPDSGSIGVSYSGEVVISSDEDERDLPEQEFEPDQFLPALDDPFGSFVDSYGIPDFTGSGVIELSYDDGL